MEAHRIIFVVVFFTLTVIPETSWAQTNQVTGIRSVGWSRQDQATPWGYVMYDVITQPMFVTPLTFNTEEQRAKRETGELNTASAARPKRHMYPYGMGGMGPYGMGGMGPYGMGGMYPHGMGGRYPQGMYGHGMGGMGGMGGSGSSAEASASSHSSSGGMGGYGGMGYPYY